MQIWSFLLTKVYQNAEQKKLYNSVSGALVPSHLQDSDAPVLQCTLGNSLYQDSYQTRLSNPFHITYEECRLWATSVLN